jgi:hypothetical protein
MPARPRLPRAALLTRIAVVAFGVLLFAGEAGGAEAKDPAHWVPLVAPGLFLWAVWAASGVFARLDRGEDFGPAMVRGMTEIGAALMLGAWAAIVLQPAVLFLIGNGFRELRGVRFDYSVENLALVLVGLALVLLARRGGRLRSDLDQIV